MLRNFTIPTGFSSFQLSLIMYTLFVYSEGADICNTLVPHCKLTIVHMFIPCRNLKLLLYRTPKARQRFHVCYSQIRLFPCLIKERSSTPQQMMWQNILLRLENNAIIDWFRCYEYNTFINLFNKPACQSVSICLHVKGTILQGIIT